VSISSRIRLREPLVELARSSVATNFGVELMYHQARNRKNLRFFNHHTSSAPSHASSWYAASSLPCMMANSSHISTIPNLTEC